MAIWQFQCDIIWGKEPIDFEKIHFLDREKSWSDQLILYGKEDETCLEFFYEGGLLTEISCRMDLRTLSKQLLTDICEFVNQIEGAFLVEGKEVLPDMEKLVVAMRNSDASRFLVDSSKFLSAVEENCL